MKFICENCGVNFKTKKELVEHIEDDYSIAEINYYSSQEEMAVAQQQLQSLNNKEE